MNTTSMLLSGLTMLGLPLLLAPAPQGTVAPGPGSGGSEPVMLNTPFVRLQPSSPGQTQSGHLHISGTVQSGQVTSVNAAGTAVFGQGTVNGVEGHSSGAGASGVYGENFASGGFGVAGRGSTGVLGDGSFSGVGVRALGTFGTALLASSAFNNAIVATTSSSSSLNSAVDAENTSSGYAVYARAVTTAIRASGTTGVYSEGDPGVGYGVYALGNIGVRAEGSTWAMTTSGGAFISGDLWVTGAKVGYVEDVVRNVDSVPLEPGMLVEIVGVEEALLGDIPVVAVRRASSANPSAVLGPIGHAITSAPEVLPRPELSADELALSRVHEESVRPRRVEGAIEPGTYGSVVTLGSFRTLRVDASYGAIQPGDLLVASPNPGHAMVDHEARTGTVVGKALAAWSGGAGEIPVMVSSR